MYVCMYRGMYVCCMYNIIYLFVMLCLLSIGFLIFKLQKKNQAQAAVNVQGGIYSAAPAAQMPGTA
jgi:hypothetical protein